MMEVVNVEADANGSNEEAVQKIHEPLANGTEAQQQQKGETVIGRQLRKKFGRKFYSGTIAEYEADTNWYKVVYEDGDGEDLEWGELEPLLVPVNETKKRRGGAGAPAAAKSGSKRRKTKALDEVERSEAEAEAKADDETQQLVVVEAVEAHNEAGDEEESQLTGKDGGDGELATENEEEPVEKKSSKAGRKRGGKGKKPKPKSPAKKASQAAKSPSKPSSTPRKRARAAETPTPRKSSRLTKLTQTPVSGVVSTSKRKQSKSEGKKKAGPSAAAKGKRVVKTPEPVKKKPEEKEGEEALTGLERGEKLRGRKIEKQFDGKLYTGEIQNYDRSRRYYKIHYEDGDEEELVWREVEPLLLPADLQLAGGASTSSAAAAQQLSTPGKKKTVITKTVRQTKVVHTRKVVTRSEQKKKKKRSQR